MNERITIPTGTELNYGTHEDSDFITLTKAVVAIVIGKLANGAVQVQLLDEYGQPMEPPLYYHQPTQPQ
ncbi:hypothetical protein KC726_01640 [Candidatus Woesebacteria bacterium]|nr:hypothetical protein [Candidatus Woesebacteria bacterium]